MIRYILKRILQVIPVLIGITVIVFTLMYFNPSDPALAILGENATPEQVEEIRQELGLDDPYIVQLGRYILNAAKGDFGPSYRTGNPVLKEVLTRYPYTLLLSVLSTFLGVIIGVVAGIVSSVKQYSIVDNIFSAFSLLGISAPSFWIAMILVLIFSVKLGILPPTGTYGFVYWILPVFTLGLQASASIMRMTRSSMLEVIRQDYITTSMAKGQTRFLTIMRHGFRNALVPIITTIGARIAAFLGGAVLVETVFAIPGLGRYIVDSVGFQDHPVVQGGVLWIAINVAIINLIIDLIYAFVDPRIKSQYSSSKPSGGKKIMDLKTTEGIGVE